MSEDPVTAKAQTVETLDQVARLLQRHIRETKLVVQRVRQQQAAITGITITQVEGDHGVSIIDEVQARPRAHQAGGA